MAHPPSLPIVVDLRDAAAFAACHLKGAASLPVQARQLEDHLFRLPNKAKPMRLLSDSAAHLSACRSFLELRGFTVDGTILADGAFWARERQQGATAAGQEFCGRLWDPNPCLEQLVGQMEGELKEQLEGRPPTAIDLACGTGRDAVFLASRGWRVLAVDYLPKQLAVLTRFAQCEGQGERIVPLEFDLEGAVRPNTACAPLHVTMAARMTGQDMWRRWAPQAVTGGGDAGGATAMDECFDGSHEQHRRISEGKRSMRDSEGSQAETSGSDDAKKRRLFSTEAAAAGATRAAPSQADCEVVASAPAGVSPPAPSSSGSGPADQARAPNEAHEEDLDPNRHVSADLVHMARFLHRPLFRHLIPLVKPGGFLVHHTFMQGSETSAVGRPRRACFLLQAGELRQYWEGRVGWRVVADDVVVLPDGRPTSVFCAQRPPAWTAPLDPLDDGDPAP